MGETLDPRSRSANHTTWHWGLYALYLLMLWVAAWTNEGWMQPDEHARVLEPALFLVRGTATLPWELTESEPIVSFLLGVIHVPALFLGEILGLSPLAEAAWLRGFSATVASTQIWAMAILLDRFLPREVRRKGWLWLFAFCPMVPLLLTRTSQENWGTTAMLWGLVALMRRREETEGEESPVRLFWGAWALTLATSFRLQLGPGIFCLLVWIFFTQNTLPRKLWLLSGAVLGVAPLAIVDGVMTGVPFKPAFHYLSYALSNEDGAHLWGANPWYDYGVHYLGSWYPPLSLVLLWPIALGLKTLRSLALVVVPFVGVHMLLAHKEARYLSPMVPLVFLAMAVGWDQVQGVWLKRLFPYVAVMCGAVCAPMWFFPQNFVPRFYETLGRWTEREPVTYVASSRTGPWAFYTRFPPSTWRALETKHFLRALAQQPSPIHGLYALERIDLATLAKVQESCKTEYDSTPAFWAGLMRKMPSNPVWQRTDVLVRCGVKQVF